MQRRVCIKPSGCVRRNVRRWCGLIIWLVAVMGLVQSRKHSTLVNVHAANVNVVVAIRPYGAVDG